MTRNLIHLENCYVVLFLFFNFQCFNYALSTAQFYKVEMVDAFELRTALNRNETRQKNLKYILNKFIIFLAPS
jgi:hypothetical protein